MKLNREQLYKLAKEAFQERLQQFEQQRARARKHRRKQCFRKKKSNQT